MKRVQPHGCDGKTRINTFDAASKIASKAAHRHHQQFHAYRCDRCGGYHIGESGEKGNRTYRRRQILQAVRVKELETA